MAQIDDLSTALVSVTSLADAIVADITSITTNVSALVAEIASLKAAGGPKDLTAPLASAQALETSLTSLKTATDGLVSSSKPA